VPCSGLLIVTSGTRFIDRGSSAAPWGEDFAHPQPFAQPARVVIVRHTKRTTRARAAAATDNAMMSWVLIGWFR
jgi:hypothetical protein